ncbi:MAG: porin family protein, partial [Saprospiraceae bacterium]|nr:porin family protein [Saprospiraceae bacterium]
MKKQTIYSLVVALLLFGFGQIAFAQISVGVRAGLSLNNFKIDPLEDGEPEPEMKVGFQVAVPIEIALGSMFAIQPELIYATHGAKQEGSNTQIEGGFTSVSSIKSDATINTLEIPVLGKLKFGSESTKLYVLAGPSFGFGLSGEYDFEGTLKTTDPLGTVIFDESSDGILDAKFVKDGYDA